MADAGDGAVDFERDATAQAAAGEHRGLRFLCHRVLLE